MRLQNCRGARSQVFNVGSTEEISIRELAELVIKTLNSSSGIEFVPYDDAYSPGFEDMQRRRPIIEKLIRKTDFFPRTTLRKIIELTAAV